jgi:hypothetical protein
MKTTDLYNEVLIHPTKRGSANELFIVSGYASATFLRKHVTDLIKAKIQCKINLIIGMPSKKSDHVAFVQLHTEFPSVEAYYYAGKVPVHNKIYSWYYNEMPLEGFSGSANYSQQGFNEKMQGNQMCNDDAIEIKNFYLSLLHKSAYIPSVKVNQRVILSNIPHVAGSIPAGAVQWIIPDISVRISFLQPDGTLPAGASGLNWGQRLMNVYDKKVHDKTRKIIRRVARNPDQAYLSIKSDATKLGFLPEKNFTFTLLTDDNKSFDCKVQQDGRKAITTTYDNSEIGKYIRDRLKIPHGTRVTENHLLQYGRTDFTLVKINDETFLFDFSV